MGIDAEDLPSPAIGLTQSLSPLCNLPVYAIFNRTARKNPPKVLHFPHYCIPLQLLLKHTEASAPTPLIQYVQTGIFYTARRSPLPLWGGRQRRAGRGERQTPFSNSIQVPQVNIEKIRNKQMTTTTLNEAQLEVLRMMAVFNTPEAVSDLKQSISNYFAQKAEAEIDRLWENGTLTESKVESFRTLHERTPYK